jgi:hypothetical protein
MGQPGRGNARSSCAESIGAARRTRGSETSQYPQEEKSIEIPLVVASERGTAQTVDSDIRGVVGLSQGFPGKSSNRRVAEGAWNGQPKRVRVPYVKRVRSSWRQFPSTAGHVQSRGKLGGPSSKAKHSLATDSELVP